MELRETVLTKLYFSSSKEEKEKLDKIYMKYLGSKSCIVSRKKPIHRHHVRLGSRNAGIWMKPPDIYCVPLFHEYHTGNKGIHSLGIETFQNRFKIDIMNELEKIHNDFVKNVLIMELALNG